MEGYESTIVHYFEVCEETLETAGWYMDHNGTKRINIEDVRKNGQEDTHEGGEAVMSDGLWVWESESFSDCSDPEYAAAILDHLNKYPPPKMEETL